MINPNNHKHQLQKSLQNHKQIFLYFPYKHLLLSSKFICISAKDGKNFDKLFEEISKVLEKSYVQTKLKIEYKELSEFTKLSKVLYSFDL